MRAFLCVSLVCVGWLAGVRMRVVVSCCACVCVVGARVCECVYAYEEYTYAKRMETKNDVEKRIELN